MTDLPERLMQIAIVYPHFRNTLTEAAEALELYEAMKEGVGVRIADLEDKNRQLEETILGYQKYINEQETNKS